MPDGTYPPHPIVSELAKELKRKADGTLSQEGNDLEQAEQALKAAKAAKQATKTKQQAVDTAAMALADKIANDPSLPELYTFAGYLGGVVADETKTTKTTWQLLYLDQKLLTWLLVDPKSILLRKDIKDETSPAGSRDYVWMKSDASVSRGEGPPQRNEIQARFLRGDFVSAGDFAASVTGGTYAPPTGPACPLTPGCCGKKTK